MGTDVNFLEKAVFEKKIVIDHMAAEAAKDVLVDE